MRPLREEHRVGLHYLKDVTVLLQRIRSAHPTAGLYEAADLQWCWRTPRSTDNLSQLFWFDHQRRGLARHILATGIDLLAEAGAERIKTCYEPDNPASGNLYLSVGFEPDR